MKSESLIATEAECAEGRTAPRVSLADIEGNIERTLFFNAADMEQKCHGSASASNPLDLLTIAIVVLKNGFTIIGKSAPASADNFDADLGQKLAYEDAVRQIWPLMGYALRQKLFEVAA